MQYVSIHYLIEYNPDSEDNILKILSWQMFLFFLFLKYFLK